MFYWLCVPVYVILILLYELCIHISYVPDTNAHLIEFRYVSNTQARVLYILRYDLRYKLTPSDTTMTRLDTVMIRIHQRHWQNSMVPTNYSFTATLAHIMWYQQYRYLMYTWVIVSYHIQYFLYLVYIIQVIN